MNGLAWDCHGVKRKQKMGQIFKGTFSDAIPLHRASGNGRLKVVLIDPPCTRRGRFSLPGKTRLNQTMLCGQHRYHAYYCKLLGPNDILECTFTTRKISRPICLTFCWWFCLLSFSEPLMPLAYHGYRSTLLVPILNVLLIAQKS